MRPVPSRRTVLAAGVAALGVTLAGCSGGSDDEESTPDPDAGRDSYGIHLESYAEQTAEVNIKVTYTWEDETPFEETVEVEHQETRSWDGVITEEVEHNVVAHVNGGEEVHEKGSTFVTPGQEDSPDAADVQVNVNEMEGDDGMVPTVSVGI